MRSIRLLRYDDLLSAGQSPRAVAASLRDRRLVRVRPGVYVDGDAWSAESTEWRIVAGARALELASRTRPVFSHETAAAIHGLPLFRADRDRVHVITTDARPGAATGVIRHRGILTDHDVVDVDDLRCTSLARTVADVARTATFEQAVTVADAALRRRCVPRAGVYLTEAAQEFRASVLEIAARSAHGVRRARRALTFADGRGQLPGESVSRIRLCELGFRHIDLQVKVPGPARTDYYVDFAFHDIRALGEFDGTMKYIDGRFTDGRSTADVFDREKQREDWIRGTTQYRLGRWGWPHMSTAKALGDRLSAFGIRPPD